MALCRYTDGKCTDGGVPEEELKHHFDCPRMRIVLLGKTGVGKSAVGNTILGRKQFTSALQNTSVTSNCQKEDGLVKDRHVAVVDTPGLFDTEKPNEEIQKEIVKCIQISSPGPHAFLLVMQLSRFTEEEKKCVEALQEIFGEQVNRYMIVLFTRGDDLEDESIHNFVQRAHPDLKEVIRKCGDRYHVFNNKAKPSTEQVTVLLDMIQRMIKENGGSYYMQEMYEEAEAKIREKVAEIRQKQDFNRNKSFWKQKAEEMRIRKEAENSDFTFSFEGVLKKKLKHSYKTVKRIF